MQDRVRKLNSAPPAAGEYVLYHARRNRRAESNHALEFAASLANEGAVPLLVYESLNPSCPYAGDRLHGFVLAGVAHTARKLAARGIGYLFQFSDPAGALPRLAGRACAVVIDDYPFLTPVRLDVPCYAVDSSCIVPMSRIDSRQYAAYAIRPKIHKLLPQYLHPVETVRLRHTFRLNMSEFQTAPLPAPVAGPGGREAAERCLREFLRHRLRRYARERNEPSARATSGLSPYLHFGQISSLEVALAVRDYAARHKLIADEFLEELIVRRELAFNFVRHTPRADTLDALPDWARATLRAHARDRRPAVYSPAEFEQAATHDPLWNATQSELLRRGVIHGYYRMYWGKKIIEWSRTHAEALATMIYLHDRYALDGRDPNTYTNILWCFGLHDRPWPERPVFGKIRYMSYDGMRRKTDTEVYIREIEGLA